MKTKIINIKRLAIMMWNFCKIVLSILISTSGAAFHLSAIGEDITFTKIADTSTQIPGESPGVTFEVFSDLVIDNGHIAFLGYSRDSYPHPLGIYKYSNGLLILVADTNTYMPEVMIPGEDGRFFQGFGPPSIDRQGRIAFWGQNRGTPVPTGIYLASGNLLSRVVDYTTTRPGSSDPFGPNAIQQSVSIDNGKVAFCERNGVYESIYTVIDSVINRVADSYTSIPGGTGNFTQLYRWLSLSGTNLAFTAEGDTDQVGVYLARTQNFFEKVKLRLLS